MNVPHWLKPYLFGIVSATVTGMAVKYPSLFTSDVQGAIIAGIAAFLGYKTNGNPTP